jgi:hypothetical protein
LFLAGILPLRYTSLLTNSQYRLLKRSQRQGRAKFDELRRTLQYVEASRASATKHVRLFSSLMERMEDDKEHGFTHR